MLQQPFKKARIESNTSVNDNNNNNNNRINEMSVDQSNNAEPIVDESLESRSMLVYGVESMKKMKLANVFLSGLGGLGVEIGM
jgi:hypothetical protein